jgi:hypothetical protein
MNRLARWTPLVLPLFATTLATTAAQAAVYTAGPHGTYATLAAALAAAAPDPGKAEVRIEAGVYAQSNLSATVGPGRELLLSGGWNSAFSTRADDPALTVFDGQQSGRVLRVDSDHGTLTLRGLTFRNARTTTQNAVDGAVLVNATGGQSTVERCVFTENVHTSSLAAAQLGAGLAVSAVEDGSVRVVASVFRNNSIVSTGAASQADYAGLYLGARTGSIELFGSRFEGNRVESPGITVGGAGGLFTDTGSITVEDNVFVNNENRGPSNIIYGAFSVVAFFPGARTVARRNIFIGNLSTTGQAPQFSLRSISAGSTAIVSDTLVAASPSGWGLYVGGKGVERLVNLTVADNAHGNLTLQNTGGILSLANSIVYGGPGPQTQFTGAVGQVANLIGTNPRFVNRAAFDYRLRSGSPARDKGNNNPPGKLGPFDVAHTARIKGGRVDRGAFESF